MFAKIAALHTNSPSIVSASLIRSPKAEAAAKVSLESGFHLQIQDLSSEYDALAAKREIKLKELQSLQKIESDTTEVENSLKSLEKGLETVLNRKRELEDETLKVFT